MAVNIKRKKMIKLTNVGVIAPSPTQKYKRVYDLGVEKKAMLDAMFLDGRPVPDIIEVLQHGWGVFKDVKPPTLTKFLYRYKWDVIDKGLVVRQELMKDKTQAALLTEVLEQFDVLKEVAQLITVQKTRVAKLLKREADMPMLFNSLGGEMKTLAQFLQQYAELSFDLGALKRVPQITKITNEGDSTLIESEGKEHITLSLNNTKNIELAAREFYRVIEQEVSDVEDGNRP